MIWFAAGFILGGFSLICLALCQIQKQEENAEEVYFAATTEIDGIKLYLNRNGAWGEFSIDSTELVRTVKEITVGPGVSIEKIGVSTRFIQTFK